MNQRKLMLLSVAMVAAMLLSGLAVVMPGEARTSVSAVLSEKGLGAATAPSAPRNLVADQGPGFVWLWWDHPATQGTSLIKKYNILRGTSSGGETFHDWVYVGSTYYNETDTFLGTTNFYNDSYDITLETTYFYQIVAVSDDGTGPVSNEVQATPSLTGSAPNAPTVTGQNKVYAAQINWTKPTVPAGSPPVRFYSLYRDPGLFPGFPFTLQDFVLTQGYLDEAGLFFYLGVQYNWTVRAINAYGHGDAGKVTMKIGGTGSTPSAPLDLLAYSSNMSVGLIWDEPTNPSMGGFTNYSVWRATSDAGPFTEVISKPTYGWLYFGVFTDTGLTNGQKYFYKVQAVNGTNIGPFSNLVNATPEPFTFPFEVNSLSAYPGNAKILLEWDYAINATGYQIWRSESSGTETLIKTVGDIDTYMDLTVQNGHTYFYKVKPVHLSTIGGFSPEANATASTGPVPDAPLIVATPSDLGVWLYSPPVLVTNPIINWTIYRGTTAGGEGATPLDYVDTLQFDTALDWQDSNSRLSPDTNYFYYVKAENLYGVSAASNEGSSFMSPTGDAPDPVTSINAAPVTNGIQVSWSSPTYEGTAILLYYELQRNDSVSGWITVDSDITDLVGLTQFTDKYVIGGVTYTYRVMASNLFGEATGFSPTASATAPSAGTPASAPQNLVATAGAGYVVLNWAAPSSVGTPAFTQYNIYRSTSSGVFTTPIGNVPAGTLTFNDTTATPGTPFFYVVKAINTAGPSPASNQVTATPTEPPRLPGAPSGLTAHGGAGYIVLGWTAPSDAGNPAFTQYDVYRRATVGGSYGSAIGHVNAGTLTFNDTTPVAGTNYSYEVKAVNTVGSSAASNEANATATQGPQVPTAPQNLQAVSGNNYVVLTWSAPANAGFPAFTIYSVYRSLSGSNVRIVNVTTGTLTYNDTTAANGNTYLYTVVAVNTVGASPASNSATGAPVPPGTAPGAPTGLTAAGHVGYVSLSWTAPSGGGASNYLVYRGTSAGGEGANPIAKVTTGTTYQDNGVVVGTKYFYTVRSNNTYGMSAASNEANATAIAITVPSAPQNLQATGGQGKVTLTWSAPANDGGSPITGYVIYRSYPGYSATQIGTTGSDHLIYNDTNVASGTSYTYYVVAQNSAGAGAQSSSQSATPTGGGGYTTTDYTWLYVGIGVLVVIVIGVVAYLLWKRGKKPKAP